jgi:SAM-dependent methyltransferase
VHAVKSARQPGGAPVSAGTVHGMSDVHQAVGHHDAHDAAAEHARRAASFGAAAAAYAQHRPSYPEAAIRWALEPVTEAGRPIRVLDLGAGTGKLTAQLAGLRVGTAVVSAVAVEPDPSMLAELRRQLPTVTAMTGRAEAIPLPDSSVDAVLAGQAAHWFDLDRAVPEIARVLRPGGVVAGLWNGNDASVAWVAGLHEISGRRTALLSGGEARDDEGLSGWLTQAGGGLFWPAESREFSHSQVRTADTLIATLRTHSMFLIMEPADRDALLARVREYLAATPETADGEFDLPLITLALRAVRRASKFSQPVPQ